MSLSLLVALKNKYPNCLVIPQGENGADVFEPLEGTHLCAVRDGHDAPQFGARDEFSLEPIPKNARVQKLLKDKSGRAYIGFDDKAAERLEKRKELIRDCKIPSQAELDAEAEAIAQENAKAAAAK